MELTQLAERVRTLNQHPPQANADYVLYWAQMNRRTSHNHARAWGERPIFGVIRWMSHNTVSRKKQWAPYRQEIDLMERTGIDPFRLQ